MVAVCFCCVFFFLLLPQTANGSTKFISLIGFGCSWHLRVCVNSRPRKTNVQRYIRELGTHLELSTENCTKAELQQFRLSVMVSAASRMWSHSPTKSKALKYTHTHTCKENRGRLRNTLEIWSIRTSGNVSIKLQKKGAWKQREYRMNN